MAHVLLVNSLFSRNDAGLARDMRLICSMGATVHPVIAAVNTATDPMQEFGGMYSLPPEVVSEQVKRMRENFPVEAIVVGFLGAAETQTLVSDHIKVIKDDQPSVPIVVNPFLLNDAVHRTECMSALNALKRDVLLVADLITPSIAEAEVLTGMTIRDTTEMQYAAEMLLTLGPKAVLLRGGDFQEEHVTDMLVTEMASLTFHSPRLLRHNISGRQGFGGVIASAIAVCLARGQNYQSAVAEALTAAKNFYLSDLL